MYINLTCLCQWQGDTVNMSKPMTITTNEINKFKMKFSCKNSNNEFACSPTMWISLENSMAFLSLFFFRNFFLSHPSLGFTPVPFRHVQHSALLCFFFSCSPPFSLFIHCRNMYASTHHTVVANCKWHTITQQERTQRKGGENRKQYSLRIGMNAQCYLHKNMHTHMQNGNPSLVILRTVVHIPIIIQI